MYQSIDLLNKYATKEEAQQAIWSGFALTKENLKKIVIFGASEIGKEILKVCKENDIEVVCFVDNDKKKEGLFIDDIPIYKPDKIKTIEADLVVLTSLIYAGEMADDLNKMGIINHVSVLFLIEMMPELFADMQSDAISRMKGTLEDLIKNKSKYINLFKQIKEKRSLDILNNILLYRLTCKGDYLYKAYRLSTENGESQYFAPDIISLEDNEVFVDCGAYDGENSKEFIEKVNDKYKKIYVIEPSNSMMDKCRKSLGDKSIEFLTCGVSDRNMVVRFNADAGTSSKIDENGTDYIEVKSLDTLVADKVTFLKMDIEGEELNSIRGAKNIIKRDRPKMAICVYHRPQDLWQITEEICNINGDYDIYARAYRPGQHEIVFYYVPSSN